MRSLRERNQRKERRESRPGPWEIPRDVQRMGQEKGRGKGTHMVVQWLTPHSPCREPRFDPWSGN